MIIPEVPKPDNPAFIDKIIVQVQDILFNNLDWLDHSFGKSQKIIKKLEGKEIHFPAIHIGSGEYISVAPDQKLGNYSFFIIEDPQNVDFRPNTNSNVRLKYSLIFWFNLDKIFPNSSDREIEAVKAEILKVFRNKLYLTWGSMDVRYISEKPENIFREYTLKEIDYQYVTQPYGGLRLDGQMSFMEDC